MGDAFSTYSSISSHTIMTWPITVSSNLIVVNINMCDSILWVVVQQSLMPHYLCVFGDGMDGSGSVGELGGGSKVEQIFTRTRVRVNPNPV